MNGTSTTTDAMTVNRNSIPTNKVFSLAEAALLTGCSLGRFRYNKEELVALGAVVSDEGWKIPLKALIQMGWADENATLPSQKKSKAERLKELESECEALRAEKIKLLQKISLLEEEKENAGKRRGLLGLRKR